MNYVGLCSHGTCKLSEGYIRLRRCLWWSRQVLDDLRVKDPWKDLRTRGFPQTNLIWHHFKKNAFQWIPAFQ